MASDGAPARSRGANRPVDPRLVRYARASRGFFAVTALITLLQTVAIVAFAWLLTSALVGAIDGRPVESLLPLVAGAALAALARAALTAWSERTAAVGAAEASLQLRVRVVGALATLGPDRVASRNAASLAVTAGRGLEALDAYFGRYLPQLVATAITLPILVAVVFVLDPISGIVVAATVPVIAAFMIGIGILTQVQQRRQYDTLHRLATRFSDTVEGLGTLKIFGRDRRAADTMGRVTRRYKAETMSVLRVSFLSGFALELLASISVAVVAILIGLRLLDGGVGLWTGLLVLLLVPDALLPLRQVGIQFHAAAEGVSATAGIFDLIEEADRLPETTDAEGAVSGSGVWARGLRIERGPWEIGPVDLDVAPGEIVLLEGPSGAGKSSVVAALLGFVPAAGEVSPGARESIAWMGQDPGLLSGSVGANVALGVVDPDPELVVRCLADAHLTLPPTLVLGVRGDGLSGGQAQRVALARALYRLRAPDRGATTLVLDEPTSALDAVTEAAVWRTVRAAADDGAGVLLVSHRTSARAIADRVVSLTPPRSRETAA